MKYIVVMLVVLFVATYGFQINLPTSNGVLTIGSEYKVEGRKESYDSDLPEYK